eukprot:Gb_38154 [translate_table: standard]
MGNEMPNRNLSTETEKESIENQSSQEHPVDVGIAMVEEMPTSISSTKTSEDHLGSGSKEETVIGKNTSAFEAESSSAMEGNGNAETMEAVETRQTSAISNVADVSDASISKAIDTTGENEDQRSDHEKTAMPAKEIIRVEDESLKNEELLSNGNEVDHVSLDWFGLRCGGYPPVIYSLRFVGCTCLSSHEPTKRIYLDLWIFIKAGTILYKSLNPLLPTEFTIFRSYSACLAAVNWIYLAICQCGMGIVISYLLWSLDWADCDRREDEKPEPSKLEIAAMQGEDKCFDEALRLSLPDTKKTIPESETTDVARKTKGDSDGVSCSSKTSNKLLGDINACKSIASITKTDTSDATSPCTENEGGAMQDWNSEYDLKSKSSDEDMEAEEKDAQIATHEPAVMGVISEEIEKNISPQASVHENTRSDLKEAADAYSHKLEKCSAVLNPSLQENGLDNSTAYTLVCAKDSSTTIPKSVQPEQDANILHLPQKTMSTAEKDTLRSKQEFNPKLPSGELFIASNESMVRNENEKISNQPSVSEMDNGFIQGESKQDNEEKMAPAVGKMENPALLQSSSKSDEHEQEKNEVDITVVNEMETAANLQSASDSLQDINATLLHKKTDESCNNAVVLETATGVTNTPNCLQSTLELIQNEDCKRETNATVMEIIEKSITLPSAAEPVEDTVMSLLQEVKDESCSNENILSTATGLQENTVCMQSSVETNQNEHGKVGKSAKELSESESADNAMIPLLHAGNNKSCSALVTMSAAEICQQTQTTVQEHSVSPPMSDGKAQECNIDNGDIGLVPLIFENKAQIIQTKNDGFADSIASIELTSNESKENPIEVLHSLTCLNTADACQKQEDLTGTPSHVVTNQDVKGDNAGSRSTENVTVPKLDKELPADSISTTANRLDEAAPDFTEQSFVPAGGKTPDTSDKEQIYSSYKENKVQPTEYLTCPKLESWKEEGEDDINTPLLAKAEGSPEEKKESGLQRNSFSDDPKTPLERTPSGKRTPLRHLFAEDSVAVSGESVKSTEIVSSQVKAVEDVWGSPAKLVASSSSPTIKEKQKARSIFSQCICCQAIH